MKRVALVVVCLGTLFAACGGSTEMDEAGRTVQQFYEHLNDGNHDAAVGLYSNEVRQMLQGDDGTLDEGFSTWAQTESREGTIDEVKIVEHKVDEPNAAATVRFELNYSGGEPQQRTVVLSKEDGSWKLGFIDPE